MNMNGSSVLSAKGRSRKTRIASARKKKKEVKNKMADFLKAVEWMKKGKKVRRKIWGDKAAYWYFEVPDGTHTHVMGHHIDQEEDREVDYFSADLFQAQDWQIYRRKE